MAEDFKSENVQILMVIYTIFEYLGDKGINAHDRDGDRGGLYKKYLGGRSQ